MPLHRVNGIASSREEIRIINNSLIYHREIKKCVQS